MTAEFVILLLAGAFAGGFINGLAGFGTSLFALGWWLQVMEPRHAVALVLVMSVVSGLQGVVRVRNAIEPRRLAVFLIPALVGIPIGLQILEHIDARTLKLIVAGFLLTYGLYFIWRRSLPSVQGDWPVADGTIGFAGGVLGAIAGLSGALPTMWLSMRDWAKEKTRAVLQPYNVIVLGLAALGLAIDGAFDREVLITIAIAFPVTMIAAQIGLWLFGRLTDLQFRRLLIALMMVSGCVLLARELTA
ncbi:MAG: sulfite exporter TauE/SafE family protein [Pseudomonadota bacterium]